MTPDQLAASSDQIRAAFRDLETVTFIEFPLFMLGAQRACIDLVDRMTLRVFHQRAWWRAVELDAPSDDIRCQLAVKMQRDQLAQLETADEIAIGKLRAECDDALAAPMGIADGWFEEVAERSYQLASALARAGSYEEAAMWFDRAAESFAACERLFVGDPALSVAGAQQRASDVRLIWETISQVRADLDVGPIEAILPLPPLPPALPGVPQIEFKHDH